MGRNDCALSWPVETRRPQAHNGQTHAIIERKSRPGGMPDRVSPIRGYASFAASQLFAVGQQPYNWFRSRESCLLGALNLRSRDLPESETPT